MSNQKQRPPRQFINGFFPILSWWSGKNEGGAAPSVILSVGIKRDALIEELKKLPTNQNGFVNITFGTKRDDALKLSAWYEEYKGSEGGGKSKTQETPAEDSPTDDLPF